MDNVVALEPRTSSKVFADFKWPGVQILRVIDNEIRIPNTTSSPILIPKNEHLCQIRATHIVDDKKSIAPQSKPVRPPADMSPPFSKTVIVDPNDHLGASWKARFSELNLKFDSVFEPVIGRYNDKSGRVRAHVTFGPALPPARKLHAPCYGKDNLQILQDKFDELEAQGVFARPEDVGVVVQHVSPSFLVRKASGIGYRLVTAFTTLGEYIKPLPTLIPTVESNLRVIAEWKFIITTDLRDAFYQIRLSKESMKWCATQTPFRGLRVYLVASQGLPGSSEWLEELMSLLFGKLVQEGWVSKVADDLYIGGQTIEQLFHNWVVVLNILYENGLKLKSIKTFIAPTHAQILGWDWHLGHISACAHKTLPLIKCEPPTTVTALRSYIGAYKVFNRVLRGCASQLDNIEQFIAGKQKNEKLMWTDAMLQSFKSSQVALSSATETTITLPRRDDQLVIVHDGSQVGVGSVLYVNRNNSTQLAGYFSAKLKSTFVVPV